MKRCSRCLYHEDIPSISFDADEVCNYCHQHDKLVEEYPLGEKGAKRLQQIVSEIKEAGRGKKVDCVVGVSGGCDSSYLLYKMKEMGLRPVAAHFDNTWNSSIATENIYKVTKALNVELFTHVVNNKEYDDIYRSFLKAGVPDVECPTDIGLASTLYRAAEKYKVRYIIEGHSFRTEGISPLGWLYMDGKYIETIQKTFGTRKLETFPNLKLTSFLKWMIWNRIKKVRPLYYMDYQKEEVKAFLTKEFDWKWYGGHHMENRFTAFYHSYFMYRRFGLDYRLLGYSALVRSQQLTRDEGLQLISDPPECDAEIVELVKKRLGLNDQELEHLMNLPKRSYKEFRTYKQTFERMRGFFWLMYKADLVPKSFYMKYTAAHN